jgi:hypothetical protein
MEVYGEIQAPAILLPRKSIKSSLDGRQYGLQNGSGRAGEDRNLTPVGNGTPDIYWPTHPSSPATQNMEQNRGSNWKEVKERIMIFFIPRLSS